MSTLPADTGQTALLVFKIASSSSGRARNDAVHSLKAPIQEYNIPVSPKDRGSFNLPKFI
jgi:hypothetical protein